VSRIVEAAASKEEKSGYQGVERLLGAKVPLLSRYNYVHLKSPANGQ
jgi:hypothetical protein